MYLFNRSDPSFLQTLFAQRMLRSIAVTNPFPRPPVHFVDVGGTLIPVVSALHQLFVFLTILAIRQSGTAGIGAAALWFSWHFATSFGHKESPRRIPPTKAICPYAVFDVIIIPRPISKIVHDITHAVCVRVSHTEALPVSQVRGSFCCKRKNARYRNGRRCHTQRWSGYPHQNKRFQAHTAHPRSVPPMPV